MITVTFNQIKSFKILNDEQLKMLARLSSNSDKPFPLSQLVTMFGVFEALEALSHIEIGNEVATKFIDYCKKESVIAAFDAAIDVVKYTLDYQLRANVEGDAVKAAKYASEYAITYVGTYVGRSKAMARMKQERELKRLLDNQGVSK